MMIDAGPSGSEAGCAAIIAKAAAAQVIIAGRERKNPARRMSGLRFLQSLPIKRLARPRMISKRMGKSAMPLLYNCPVSQVG